MEIKINGSDYGLEEVKAKQIEATFKPMLEKMTELEAQANEVFEMAGNEITKETCVKARKVRFLYRETRTGTADIHKKLKSFYLNGGRFVDGFKNAQKFASEGMEEKLLDIEKHFENVEKAKVLKLSIAREARLNELGVEFPPANLGEMETEVWDNYISGVEVAEKLKKEAEAKAEEERIENKRVEKLHNSRKEEIIQNWRFLPEENREDNFGKMSSDEWADLFGVVEVAKGKFEAEQKRIKAENERLEREAAITKARGEELRPYIVFIRDYDKLISLDEADYQKELTEIKKGAELQWKFDRDEKAKNDRKAESDRQERVRLERKLQEQKDNKERDKQAREKAIQDELNKGDSAKFKDLLADCESLKTKYQFKSKSNQKKLAGFVNLMDKVVIYLKS